LSIYKKKKLVCRHFLTIIKKLKNKFITFNSNAAFPIPDAAPDPESPTK
jgi:hypothetical protein